MKSRTEKCFLVMLLLILLSSCGSSNQSFPVPKVNDCYDISQEESVSRFALTNPIDCNLSHNAETYLVGKWNNEVLPFELSDEKLLKIIIETCGTWPLTDKSPMNFWGFFIPNANDWKKGERWIRCDAMNKQEGKDGKAIYKSWKGLRLTMKTIVPSKAPLEIGVLNAEDELSRNTVFRFDQDVPDFPVKVKDYSLMSQESYDTARLFENFEWEIPIAELDPNLDGGATMSCRPYYWVIRWRSNNPDVEITVSTGMTDGPYDPFDDLAMGGAGISEGFSCVVPAFKFGKAINGNQSNLVDLNFEYQLWEYHPKI